MWFKNQLLLLIFPILSTSLPLNADKNEKHLVKRESTLSRVFGNNNSGKSLVQKFLGNDYTTKHYSTGNADLTFYFPTKADYNSGDDFYSSTGGFLNPDCIPIKIENQQKIIVPNHKEIPFIGESFEEIKKVNSRLEKVDEDVKKYIEDEIIKKLHKEVEDQVKIEIEKNIKKDVHEKHDTIQEAHNEYDQKTHNEVKINNMVNEELVHNIKDYIEIPKYKYEPSKVKIEKHIEFKDQHVPQVNEYTKTDKTKITIDKIVKQPSLQEPQYYSIKENDISDFSKFYGHSANPLSRDRILDPKKQPNSLSYHSNDKTVHNFLKKTEKTKNIPAPIEEQPNLLLSNWLELNKKVFNKVKPEEHKNIKTTSKKSNKIITKKTTYNQGTLFDKDSMNRVFHKMEIVPRLDSSDSSENTDVKKVEVVKTIVPNITTVEVNNKKVTNAIEDNKVNKITTVKKSSDDPIVTVNENIIHKNKEAPTKYIFFSNTTTEMPDNDKYIIKKNITKTTVTVNESKTPLELLLEAFANNTDFKFPESLDDKKENDESLGPFHVVESKPGSPTKVIEKTEYISKSPEGNRIVKTTISNDNNVSQNKLVVNDNNLKISKLVQPLSADGVKVYTSRTIERVDDNPKVSKTKKETVISKKVVTNVNNNKTNKNATATKSTTSLNGMEDMSAFLSRFFHGVLNYDEISKTGGIGKKDRL